MGRFDASLRTIGDRTGLAATLTIDNGRLMIEAGDQTIGDWALDEIHLEQTPNGYRMAAEGEQILIDLPNADEFDLALRGKKVRGAKRAPKSVKQSESEKAESKPVARVASTVPAEKAVEAKPSGRRAKHSREPKTDRKQADESDSGLLATLDKALDTAHGKWGGLFPSWMFTRGTAYVLVAALVLLLVFPQIVFYALLLGGVLLVMLGAVLYTDSVLSARWLPGRMTPMHVLIFGVGTLLLGVVVALAARNLIYMIVLGVVIVAGVYLTMTRAAGRASEQ